MSSNIAIAKPMALSTPTDDQFQLQQQWVAAATQPHRGSHVFARANLLRNDVKLRQVLGGGRW